MFRTNRLYFREVMLSDLHEVHHLHTLPIVDQYNTLGIPEDISMTEAMLAEWIKNQQEVPRTEYVLFVEDLQGIFIGVAAIWRVNFKFKSAEIWYKLHPHYWGKGFGTEAAMALINFGFSTLNLHRIEAGCAVQNIASARVLEKAGMTREGSKRKALPIRGEWVDNYEYAILENDRRASMTDNFKLGL